MIQLLCVLIYFVSILAFANKEKSSSYPFLYVFTGCLIIIYTTLRDGDAVADYDEYIEYYTRYKDILVEPSFTLISWFVHNTLNTPIFLFFIYATIGISLKFVAIRQLTELAFLSILIYLSYFFILHELTQIRAGVASGMLLLCIKPLYERNLSRFLLYVIIASLFHVSAVVIFALWLINPYRINRCVYVLLVPIAYILQFLNMDIFYAIPVPYIEEKMSVYKEMMKVQDIDVFNSTYLIRCFLMFYFLYFANAIRLYNKYAILLIKIYVVSLFFYTFFASIPVVGIRISEMVGIVEIVLFPLIYYTITQRKVSKVFTFLIAVLFCYAQVFLRKLIR